MKLIVGLGNPGDKYHHTRHNVGFMVVDELKTIFNFQFSISNKLSSEIAKDNNFIFVKPLSFMNNSGVPVSKVIKNYKLEIKNLIVIHDDLDIPLGEYKIQFGKGPKVHNGVNSIEQHLNTDQFWRVRVGIDNRDPDNRIPGDVYVLQKFSAEELNILNNVIDNLKLKIKNL